MLEQAMGLERFRTAYQCMKAAGVSDDEQLLSEKIAELMGEGFQDLFPSLLQLTIRLVVDGLKFFIEKNIEKRF